MSGWVGVEIWDLGRGRTKTGVGLNINHSDLLVMSRVGVTLTMIVLVGRAHSSGDLGEAGPDPMRDPVGLNRNHSYL